MVDGIERPPPTRAPERIRRAPGRGVVLAAVLALTVSVGCNRGTQDPGPGASPTAPTTVPAVEPEFPDAVPMVSDGECAQPQVDPARPSLGPVGEPTDGVHVQSVDVVDQDVDEVDVTFVVSAPSGPPIVEAGSGERWVVVSLVGVRRFPAEVPIASARARRLPATVCDDSAWVFALSFDRPVQGLELADGPDSEVTVRVILES